MRELSLTSRSPRKEPGVAAILSFLLTGLGHIYNGKIGLGIGLIAIQFITFLFWILVLPIFVSLALWIWGMVASAGDARQINEAIDALIDLEKAEEEEKQSEAERTASAKFSSAQFREALRKLLILREQGVYSEEEADEEVRKCILELQSKDLETDTSNYLVVAAEMRKAGLVSETQLHSLKTLLL